MLSARIGANMGNKWSSSSAADDLRALAPSKEEDERKLTREEMLSYLHEVAEILKQKGKNITIVAIGGAVSVILFHSRDATEDIDFLYRTKQKNEDVTAIIAAAEIVASEQGKHPEQGWMNNHASVFLAVSPQICLSLPRLTWSPPPTGR